MIQKKRLINEGFTLIEIMVSISLLAVGFVVIMNLFSMAIRSAKESSDYSYALILAYQKMGEISLSKNISSTMGEFENTKYRWRLEVKPYPFDVRTKTEVVPKVYETKIRVLWSNDENKGVELTTLKTTY